MSRKVEVDLNALAELANRLEADARNDRTLSPSATLSVARIIRRSVGPSLNYPTRAYSRVYAKKFYENHDGYVPPRHAFDHGVEWTIENTQLDPVYETTDSENDDAPEN